MVGVDKNKLSGLFKKKEEAKKKVVKKATTAKPVKKAPVKRPPAKKSTADADAAIKAFKDKKATSKKLRHNLAKTVFPHRSSPSVVTILTANVL